MPSVPRPLRTQLQWRNSCRCPAAGQDDVSAPAMTRRPSEAKPRIPLLQQASPTSRSKKMKNLTQFESRRRLDVICVGRLGVDLYAQQIGSRLEDVTSFAKYLGGSSGNIAANTARLGLKSAMLTRVGDDQMGRFLTETLAKEGCDVSHVVKDPERLTALVLLGLKDRQTFPLVFYRENCADMALEADDFDEAFIASSRALLITGTHFSTAQVNETSRRALHHARRNNVRTILDIDYRPVLWGLTGKAQGEVRYVSSEGVTKHMRGILPLFDLIVGTEEEFEIAGGEEDLLATLRSVREVTKATLVVKRGALGCSVFEGEIPGSLDQGADVRRSSSRSAQRSWCG